MQVGELILPCHARVADAWSLFASESDKGTSDRSGRGLQEQSYAYAGCFANFDGNRVLTLENRFGRVDTVASCFLYAQQHGLPGFGMEYPAISEVPGQAECVPLNTVPPRMDRVPDSDCETETFGEFRLGGRHRTAVYIMPGDLQDSGGLQDSGDFSCNSVSSTLSIDREFAGAATAANGLVVFAPRYADCVGVFNAASNAFSCVSIASTLSIDDKFAGAATAANGRVVFVPNVADCVGVYDLGLGPPQTASSTWHVAPLGALQCDAGSIASSSNCQTASAFVRNLAGHTTTTSVLYGSGGSCGDDAWGMVPLGCSVQTSIAWTPHFKSGGVNCDCIANPGNIVAVRISWFALWTSSLAALSAAAAPAHHPRVRPGHHAGRCVDAVPDLLRRRWWTAPG